MDWHFFFTCRSFGQKISRVCIISVVSRHSPDNWGRFHRMLKVSILDMSLKIIDLTHWGRVTHICVGYLTIIGPDNGLSPGRRQAIIWTNAGILLIIPWGTNFSEILLGIQAFSFKKMHWKMSSAKWRPFCLGLNVSTLQQHLPRVNELICAPTNQQWTSIFSAIFYLRFSLW